MSNQNMSCQDEVEGDHEIENPVDQDEICGDIEPPSNYKASRRAPLFAIDEKESSEEKDQFYLEMNYPVDKDEFYNVIETSPSLKLSRFSLFLIDKPLLRQSIPTFKQFSLPDEKSITYVYKKTLQAILNPVTPPVTHKMTVCNGPSLTRCFECGDFILNLCCDNQVVRCTKCGIKVHTKCKDLLDDDCFTRDKIDGEVESSVEENIVTKSILETRQNDNEDLIDLLRKVFKMDPVSHLQHLKEVQEYMCNDSLQCLAKITIKVICARNLSVKDRSGASDPYVTIQVGKVKQRTKTIMNNINPSWEETFYFQSNNPKIKIKIRVWDRDKNLKSMMKGLFKSSTDDFLGQIIIDPKTVVGESDLWYTLEKRTERSTAVSGSIRLAIEERIAGEEIEVPCHQQYSFLHENVLSFFVESGKEFSELSTSKENEDSEIYFDPLSQEIVDKFAKSFAIEPVFRDMTHVSCLCEIQSTAGVPAILISLLDNIKLFYEQTSSTSSISEKITESNFGKWKFMKILDHLQTCLKLSISSYRCFYPPDEVSRLLDLKNSIDLLITISCFKNEAQISGNSNKASAVLRECIKINIETTYSHLFNHCPEIYEQHFRDVIGEKDDFQEEGPGCKRNLRFWRKLITLVASTINEDANIYSKILDRFPREYTLESLSFTILWESLSNDLKYALEEHELESYCKTYDYVNLHIMINELHRIQPDILDNQPPQFPLWFEPFIKRWFNENDRVSLSYANSAFHKDKADQFKEVSIDSLFSSSVTDIFTQLNQCLTVVTTFIKPNPDVGMRYFHLFSLTIEKVLISYSNLLNNDFSSFFSKPEIACRLMNNIQQIKIELEKLFILMGGEKELSSEVVHLLNLLQRSLSKCLKKLVSSYCVSISKPSITEKIFVIRNLLSKQNFVNSKASNENQKDYLVEVDQILFPLVGEFLEQSLSMFARQCNKAVLRRILKKLWKLVLIDIECIIVLPPLRKKNETTISKLEKTPLNLSAEQCLVFEMVLESLIELFWASGNGLEKKYLESNVGYKILVDALLLTSQPTDVLVKAFIDSQKNQISLVEEKDDSVGSLTVDVEVFQLQNEHKFIVKVVAVDDIKWTLKTSIFQPFVEVSVLGPHILKRKKCQTKSISNTWSPRFNELFSFSLGNEPDLEFYEVHFCLKEYRFLRDDLVIGVTVFQLRTLSDLKKDARTCRLPFKRFLRIDDIGNMVLKILAQRSNDETAKEFVNLKTQTCHEPE